MFERLARGWFQGSGSHSYNSFIRALFEGNLEEMNVYMNEVATSCFSTFDTGTKPSQKATPERFYHGFVLGLRNLKEIK